MRGSWLALLPALADSTALVGAGLLAYTVRTSGFFLVDDHLRNPWQYTVLLLFSFGLWHLLMLAQRGYERQSLLFRIDELVLQFQTSIWLLVLVMAGTFLYRTYDYSRLIVFFTWLGFVVLGNIARQFAHRFRERLHRRGFGRLQVTLAGTGERRDLLEQRIRENPGLGLEIADIPPGMTLREFLATKPVDEVFIFDDTVDYPEAWQWREVSCNPQVIIHLVPRFGNLYLRNLRGGFFDGMVLISLDYPMSRTLTFALKRAIDFSIAGLFMILFSPLMALIALLTRLDSPGPLIFRQQRVGQDGALFTILKFRTMHADSEAYAVTPTAHTDPRITRVGRFLRATGLDELPQLWNVLRGDMSLVGPRPEMPFIVETYTDLERKRLKVRPGITGLWQVYARSANLPIHSHIEYDLYYIENVSIPLDLMILLDTIPTLVLRTGI
jgi:exopolysaccharide biosynthesis polyprenyl glycosylphosphotransferase